MLALLSCCGVVISTNIPILRPILIRASIQTVGRSQYSWRNLRASRNYPSSDTPCCLSVGAQFPDFPPRKHPNAAKTSLTWILGCDVDFDHLKFKLLHYDHPKVFLEPVTHEQALTLASYADRLQFQVLLRLWCGLEPFPIEVTSTDRLGSQRCFKE